MNTQHSDAVVRQRVIDHGEVFTPPGLVRDMLDLVEHECARVDSRFLEPACGDGNFLAEVLHRKLGSVTRQSRSNRPKWERDAILAVCSLYGIDLLVDNIVTCRARLLAVLLSTHEEQFDERLPEPARLSAEFILSRNILQGDALSFRTTDDQPIIFAEWSPVNGTMLKRRDFSYGHLLDHADVANMPLFSDLGQDVYLPTPAGDFPPCHYLKVAEQTEARA